MNARPMTTSTNPAICVCVAFGTTLAIAAAPAPSTTNTAVKPAMNGMLARTTRRVAPREPSAVTSSDEIAAR